ncbi:putative ribonuclease H-like domain-containing protein [Tanacetum coccineum]
MKPTKQLRTSSNLRNHATLQDGRVTMQQVQGRQVQSYAGARNKGNATSSGANNEGGQARVVKCYNCQGEGHIARQCTQPKRPKNATWFKEKAMLVEVHESGQVLDEEQLAFLADPRISDYAYDSDYDDISSAKAVLMANLSNYGSNVLSEVPKFETYQNDMDNQSVQAMQHFEQTHVYDYPDNEITSDSNIILYSQYLKETQQAVDKQNESLTVELERYKERVKTFEQRLNIDLSSREKLIDSQMDDMIRDRLESKEKESKYMDKEIDLEKKIKELDNIVYKVGQSAQTVRMLTNPQVFYDDTHKQALGYQNMFYLKKVQRIKTTLYDGSIISRQHDVIPVTDKEETLILEEVSRSKMLAKQNDQISKEKKINTTPINYVELNQLSEDFSKRCVPQQELSAEQAFWLQNSHPNTDQSDI